MANDDEGETHPVPRMLTSHGYRLIPACAEAFYASTLGQRERSKAVRKWKRYKAYVNMVTDREKARGIDALNVLAPKWVEFDIHDLKTH